MKIDVLTLFPEMFNGFFDNSIIKRGLAKGNIEVMFHNFRDYSTNKHHRVDDTVYGGGAGLLLAVEPIYNCLKAIKTEESYTILLSPQGRLLKQNTAYELIKQKHLIIICGHYEGFDERIKNFIDLEISIGDYVLTGGEVPAMVLLDTVIRLAPGTIKEDSHLKDSFSEYLLEHPQYTKPYDFMGMTVPDVLVNGNHKEIAKWQYRERLKRTFQNRPDLLNLDDLSAVDLAVIKELEEHK